MGIRAQGNPIASFADLWSQTGTDAATNPASGAGTATGGTKTTPGDGYIYHHFYATVPGAPYTKAPNTSETLVISGGALDCDYLIVGGGGAGGYDSPGSGGGGGGGAGAVYYATGVTLSAATYPVTVGGGGQNSEAGGPTTATPGDAQGDDSVFNSITAAGGGRGGRGAVSPVPIAAGIAGGCGGGGAGRSPGGPTDGGGGAGGSSTGAGSHPGSSNVNAVSPPVGWGYDGAGGSLDPCNCGSGGGGGGIGGAPLATVGNYIAGGVPSFSIGGGGGAGAKYTVDGATVNIGGGGQGGVYGGKGNNTTPPAHPFGGGVQDDRDWPAPMRIYPAPTVNIKFGGLDGSGGGGCGGCNNTNGPQVVSGAPDGPTPANDPWSPLGRAGNTASGRGGCGLVQIRYPV
jgi:hypothetical protein